MALDLLGGDFDIHGGGNDLQFPHHENEIAQSTCAGHGFANVWMHNEMLQVEGKKMSKSLGNFFTVRDLLDQGVPGEVIRFVMLSTHYRKPMDWTEKKRVEAEKTLRGWFDHLKSAHFDFSNGSASWKLYLTDETYMADAEVRGYLQDDLNTAGAISRIHQLSKSNDFGDLNGMLGSLILLGLLDEKTSIDLLSLSGVGWFGNHEVEHEKLVTRLLFKRQEARKLKDFAKSDLIRDALTEADIIVEDGPDGPHWSAGPNFDPSKLEGLL